MPDDNSLQAGYWVLWTQEGHFQDPMPCGHGQSKDMPPLHTKCPKTSAGNLYMMGEKVDAGLWRCSKTATLPWVSDLTVYITKLEKYAFRLLTIPPADDRLPYA